MYLETIIIIASTVSLLMLSVSHCLQSNKHVHLLSPLKGSPAVEGIALGALSLATPTIPENHHYDGGNHAFGDHDYAYMTLMAMPESRWPTGAMANPGAISDCDDGDNHAYDGCDYEVYGKGMVIYTDIFEPVHVSVSG